MELIYIVLPFSISQIIGRQPQMQSGYSPFYHKDNDANSSFEISSYQELHMQSKKTLLSLQCYLISTLEFLSRYAICYQVLILYNFKDSNAIQILIILLT